MVSLLRVIKSFKFKLSYSYSSVQGDMPYELSNKVIHWGEENIPEEELSGDGREHEIHVTILYGLHHHDPFELRGLISNFGPIDIELGEISVFENEGGDVVKLSVNSPRLCKLNKLIAANLAYTTKYDSYIPHITIAYVKSGCGKKYQGRKDFLGTKVTLNSVFFSGNDNRKTELVLC